MSKFNTNAILFNLGGASVLVFVAGYMASGLFEDAKVAKCSKRFPAGVQYALDGTNGAALSTIEMQARAGMRAWGMLENAKVVQSNDATGPKRLDVKLAPARSEDDEHQNGIGFIWPVASLQGAQSACLSYSLMIPQDLTFSEPVRLPGLTGFDASADAAAQSLMAHIGWSSSGELGVEIRTPTTADGWLSASKTTVWPRGRWVQVDQEVVMNEPGQSNGAVRVWIDGDLRVESLDLNMRPTADMKFIGVVADTGYIRREGAVATVSMTPFMVQWQ